MGRRQITTHRPNHPAHPTAPLLRRPTILGLRKRLRQRHIQQRRLHPPARPARGHQRQIHLKHQQRPPNPRPIRPIPHPRSQHPLQYQQIRQHQNHRTAHHELRPTRIIKTQKPPFNPRLNSV